MQSSSKYRPEEVQRERRRRREKRWIRKPRTDEAVKTPFDGKLDG